MRWRSSFKSRGSPIAVRHRSRCYKGHKLDKEYFADFICYEKVVVELKCVARLVNAHKAQVINYLHGTGLPVGLLVNFAEASLKWERLTHFKEAAPRD